ncbi:TetR/AcrR family transcriptional regulator [Sphingomonas sp. DT-204]|uniref:TetR/AcrR family transcriptional regulator n=1 Tax=Sphingomonas sp. DT-204 TaxID=3396166 RepID=UPI003F1C2059
MNRPVPSLVRPRKTPQQARSTATVEAIHTATIQVLLADGAVRLTTTRVAERAGVSVGTMYQYFPHKQALLFATLERHLQTIERSMMIAVERLEGSALAIIADGLANAWLDAKTADMATSRAIYAIATEFDIAELMERGLQCIRREFGRLLSTAPDGHFDDLDSISFMLMALIGGSVRAVMEAGASERDLACLRRELPRACRAYLSAANQADAISA